MENIRCVLRIVLSHLAYLCDTSANVEIEKKSPETCTCQLLQISKMAHCIDVT